MENSAPVPQPSIQPAPVNAQQINTSNQNNGTENLSSKNKIKDLAAGLIGTIIVYEIIALLWKKIAYAVFAPSLAESGADFPGIIFFAYIVIIPVFAITAIILWKSRRNLAIGILVGAVLTTLYFLLSCSMTLATGGCLGLLT